MTGTGTGIAGLGLIYGGLCVAESYLGMPSGDG